MLVVKNLNNTEKNQEESRTSSKILPPQKMDISECSCYKFLNAIMTMISHKQNQTELYYTRYSVIYFLTHAMGISLYQSISNSLYNCI